METCFSMIVQESQGNPYPKKRDRGTHDQPSMTTRSRRKTLANSVQRKVQRQISLSRPANDCIYRRLCASPM
ncbi:hypothetical protein WN51_09863 [Melipona quadrifasciata]|uniref:Uncharacterized protein n=1 Tax=Melipona quadrifasciata TaxID=166423 RepID=A0A0M9A7N2_9HYME|nr:hypothetical protein WN51_09863 [Melipona quadrifasciata]